MSDLIENKDAGEKNEGKGDRAKIINKKMQRGKTTQEEIETSKNIKKLIKLKKFNEALKLTGKYPYNPVIQSQKIKILITKGNIEEAKRIGNREEFINYAPIQSQMITIAIQEGNIEETTIIEVGMKKSRSDFQQRIKDTQKNDTNTSIQEKNRIIIGK